jgi:predicted AAA+ superfamily ATPase
LRSDAVERAIYKDIPQAFGVDNPKMLERLLYTLAGQICGILSPTNICKELSGLSQPTFDKYLSYLTQAFLVFTLENYSGSELSKQKRGRKLYFVVGPSQRALHGVGRDLHDPGEMGLLIENMVAAHLHALSQQPGAACYWRDKQEEVDLVFDHPQKPLGFEISSSARHRRGLQISRASLPAVPGSLLSVAGIAATRDENADRVGTLPLDLLLVAASAQTEQELQRRLRSARGSGE